MYEEQELLVNSFVCVRKEMRNLHYFCVDGYIKMGTHFIVNADSDGNTKFLRCNHVESGISMTHLAREDFPKEKIRQ